MARTVDNNAHNARVRLVSALHRTAAGDRSGLRHVYDLTSAKLFGICLRISGDREAAEDILQDVYVKVWRRAASFDEGLASPISWLAMIARNAAIDWRRTQARHDAAGEDALDTVADDAPLADATIQQDEAQRRLLTCLDGLDIRQSDAIRRTFLGGLTYQELAERMGTPLGTIKSWIRRGMQGLKECLGDG
ncbi:sigma-70 family RNA polymerase sigma factor [Sphingobium sufflavum]|uniref:sigma-70 family RNA polymerase sigma factor n=1 Tax=Sphingobium sufflavum TaxID=1129547 RepID=UPI001F473AEC|nr:sigma-70 family RNA polymerase sigma factor [Sphingobium sufflavum]MCE7796735.1 sigma-70 family RNA polymerase sigma factor [Sphingobium sufflavum]